MPANTRNKGKSKQMLSKTKHKPPAKARTTSSKSKTICHSNRGRSSATIGQKAQPVKIKEKKGKPVDFSNAQSVSKIDGMLLLQQEVVEMVERLIIVCC